MVKKIILIFIILFIISCTRMDYSPDFHTGTQGLELEFLENTPPDELLYIKNTPTKFLIGIGFRNKGANDITQGNIIISSELGKIRIENSQKDGIIERIPIIKGKDFAAAEGEFIPKYYEAEVIGAESGVPESLVNIEAKACYKYKTTAPTEICIDVPQPEYLKIKKSCEQKKTGFSGQGAPIVISKIKEDIIPGDTTNQLRLEIYFENRGPGKIVDRDCKTSDIVDLEEISFSDYSTEREDQKKIRCETDNKIKIEKEKENKIVCYADLSKDINPYLTILITKLDYWYSTSITKKIKIKNTEYEKEIETTKEKPIVYNDSSKK